MYWPNLKSVPFPVLEIIGGDQKFGQSLDTPTLLFLKKISYPSLSGTGKATT